MHVKYWSLAILLFLHNIIVNILLFDLTANSYRKRTSPTSFKTFVMKMGMQQVMKKTGWRKKRHKVGLNRLIVSESFDEQDGETSLEFDNLWSSENIQSEYNQYRDDILEQEDL